MVSVSANIDAASVSAFNDALLEYQKTMRKDAETAPRQAAILICKSLAAKSRTKIAPKYARGGEYKAIKDNSDPKHLFYTTKDGRKLRRFHLSRPPRGKEYVVYALNKADLRKNRLELKRRGLARQSWGWVMHNIFSGNNPDTPWNKRKNDKRNPKDAMRESMSRPFLAVISNRLDYALDALKNGEASVREALEKATNSILKRVKTRNFGRG